MTANCPVCGNTSTDRATKMEVWDALWRHLSTEHPDEPETEGHLQGLEAAMEDERNR